MLNIHIAIPCRNEKHSLFYERNAEMINLLEEKNIAKIHLHEFFNNKLSLTKFYNEQILSSRKDESVDYLILMHDDVHVPIDIFVNNLLEFNKDGVYDIIGLAGTKKLSLSHTPLSWFTGSRRFQDARFGHVIHETDNPDLKSDNFYNSLCPDILHTKVLTLDGLFLCLNRKVLTDENIKFDDELFMKDFYDLDFCLNATIKNNLSVGVFVIPTVHTSVGMGILSDHYIAEERKFRVKWDSIFNSAGGTCKT